MSFSLTHLLIPLLLLCCSQQPCNGAENATTLYYGFFFDYTAASSIKFAADQYLRAYLDIPLFSEFLQNVSIAAGITDVFTYYERPLDPNTGKYDPYYHVTAQYCGPDQELCASYAQNHSEAINKKYEMQLVGYVLTNRTFGIRINVTEDQLPLFNKDIQTRDSRSISPKAENIQAELPEIRLEAMSEYVSGPATTTKAHITLGCAPGIPAVTTGPDLGGAIEYERDNIPGTIKETWKLPDPLDPGNEMTLILYKTAKSSMEDYVFVMYPSVKMIANATLSPYFQPIVPNMTDSAVSWHGSMMGISLPVIYLGNLLAQ